MDQFLKLKNMILEHKAIVILIFIIIVFLGGYLFGRGDGYDSGMAAGFVKGQESIKCDGKSHETNPYIK
jgi:hypothetical protein